MLSFRRPCGRNADLLRQRLLRLSTRSGLVLERRRLLRWANMRVAGRLSACRGPGELCMANTDCCGSGTCTGGHCSADACFAVGTDCEASAQCCDGLSCTSDSEGDMTCACNAAGTHCLADADCCDGLSCLERSLCVPRHRR